MTTLVTGFEPFRGLQVNTSQLVATAVAAGGRRHLAAAVLPTSYRGAEAQITQLLRRHRPRAVILLGLAAKQAEVRLEQVALNLDDSASADNDGEVRLRRRIVEAAPVGYWSTLALEQMAEDARRLGEAVGFSHDAGGYVCNHAFFIAMHRVKIEFPETRCGFVHLPLVHEPSPRLERLVDLVRIWVDRSIEQEG